MITKIRLLDYQGRESFHEVDLSSTVSITLMVSTGDELLLVVKNDGTIDFIDSCEEHRYINFIDNLYTVYISGNKYSLLDDPEWTERKSSEWCRIIEEE